MFLTKLSKETPAYKAIVALNNVNGLSPRERQAFIKMIVDDEDPLYAATALDFANNVSPIEAELLVGRVVQAKNPWLAFDLLHGIDHLTEREKELLRPAAVFD
ncbi:hypothetical protein ACVWZM_002935 [Bradyrhizobium sp. USDA 4501]